MRRRTNTWFDKGWRLLNDQNATSHKVFHAFINILILISVGIVFYEVASKAGGGNEADDQFRDIIAFVDTIILWIFVAEYSARLVFIRDSIPKTLKLNPAQKARHFIGARIRFIFSPWGLIDLSALLPVFPLLRSLRMLRLLRLFRSAQFFKYTNPFTTLSAAFRDNALLFGVALSLVVAVVVLAALMMYVAEFGTNPDIESFADTVWWSIVTVTTVGYGDISPSTFGGKVIASGLMFAGMFLIAMFAGLVSSTLVGRLMPLRAEQVRMSSIKDHVVIAGWNLEIPMMLEEMETEYGNEMPEIIVLANSERPPSLPSKYIFAQGEPTRESELEKARIRYARAVVCVSDHASTQTPSTRDAVTVLTVFTIRSFEEKLATPRKETLHIVAEILDHENYSHAIVAGANEVIETSRLGSSLLAHTAGNPGIGIVASSLLLATNANLYADPIPTRLLDGDSMNFGKIQTRLRQQFGVLVVGVVHNDEMKLNPPDNTPVYVADRLVYIGSQHIL